MIVVKNKIKTIPKDFKWKSERKNILLDRYKISSKLQIIRATLDLPGLKYDLSIGDELELTLPSTPWVA